MKPGESPFFASLSGDELDTLLKASRTVSVERGELLYTTDDLCDCLTVVLSGGLKVSKLLPSGNEQIIKFLGEGDLIGEGFVFSRGPYRTNVVAERPSEVLEIPLRVLLKAFKNERFLLSFLGSLSEKIDNLSDLIEILSLRKVRQRVAMYLIDKSTRENSETFALDKTRSEIAGGLGTVREVISRALSDLQREGIISLEGRKVKILDPRALERILPGKY